MISEISELLARVRSSSSSMTSSCRRRSFSFMWAGYPCSQMLCDSMRTDQSMKFVFSGSRLVPSISVRTICSHFIGSQCAWNSFMNSSKVIFMRCSHLVDVHSMTWSCSKQPRIFATFRSSAIGSFTFRKYTPHWFSNSQHTFGVISLLVILYDIKIKNEVHIFLAHFS